MPDINCGTTRYTPTTVLSLYSATRPAPTYYIITSASDALTGTNRDVNGKLTTGAIKTYINSNSPKIAPLTPPDATNSNGTSKTTNADGTPNTSNVVNTYMNQQNTFANNINTEYVHYYCRYKYSLNQFLSLLESKAKGQPATDLDAWLGATRTLNKRLNDLYQIYTYLGSYYMGKYNTSTRNINRINSEIENRNQAIIKEGELLSRNSSQTELYNKMVEYTKEKAKATSNLISLYACMNLIAIGMLFYVYKAT